MQIKQKGIMIRNLRNKYLIGIFFLGISNSVYCQIRNKIDTIQNNNCRIIIEYPAYNRINITNYEEGYFKTINCIQDTVFITIFDGRMVNLPIIDLSDKTIESESFLSKYIRCIRGYSLDDNSEKRYFREDDYLDYGVSVTYENVNQAKFDNYEDYLNNVKIIPIK